MSYNLFVYGTLRRNCPGHSYLKNSEFIGYDYIKGFIMLDFGDYPMIFESVPENSVAVEIYKVDEYTLYEIDRFEEYYGYGNPENLYSRTVVVSASGYSGYIYTGVSAFKERAMGVIGTGDWVLK